jgi:transcriptional regulator with XRE-family HTH domain
MEASQTVSIRNRILGILVRRARGKAGKSQRECAESLGISPAAFGQCEQGKRGFSLPQLEALAYMFEVPPASLWDDGYASSVEAPAELLPLPQMLGLRRKMLAIKFRQCREGADLSQREMSQLLGCSTYRISQYEKGTRDIPLAELETVAERCGQTLTDFVDKETIPLGQAEQQRQILARLNELPPDVRDFVLKPTNALYLRIALLLSTMKADDLRQIAETLLDITY